MLHKYEINIDIKTIFFMKISIFCIIVIVIVIVIVRRKRRRNYTIIFILLKIYT